jgi:hypothetical protein
VAADSDVVLMRRPVDLMWAFDGAGSVVVGRVDVDDLSAGDVAGGSYEDD